MQFDEPTKKNAKKLLYFRHCQSVYRLFKDLRFDPGFLFFLNNFELSIMN